MAEVEKNSAPFAVEITPEMNEAGVEVVWRTPVMEPEEAVIRRMVNEIFSAMLRASPVHRF
jgi:hypothetical protein